MTRITCRPRTGISSGTLRSVIEYGLPLPFTFTYQRWLRVRMNRKSVAPLRHDTERSANRRAGV